MAEPGSADSAGLATKVADMLGAGGHDARAARLRTLVERRDAPARIVLIGETKRGKSSLVNALVARPGLSPVDVEITTAVAIVIRYGETPTARVVLDDASDPRPIPLDGVAAWASASGASSDQRVRAVEIELPHPILRAGIVLVDTPGIAGVIAAHGRLAMAAARGADGCVFVVDATQPVLRPELDIMRLIAGDRVPLIVCVTKIDRQPDWQSLVEESRRSIAAGAPELAGTPLVAVSSRIREQAVVAPDSDSRRALDRASHVPDLWNAIRHQIVTPLAERRRSRWVDEAIRGLDLLAGDARARLDAARSDAYDEADRVERERLDRVQFEMGEWDRALRRGMGSAQTAVNEAIERGFRELRDALNQLIDVDPANAATNVMTETEDGLQMVAAGAYAALLEGATSVAAELGRLCDATAARPGAALDHRADIADWDGFSGDIGFGGPDAVMLLPSLLAAAGLAKYSAPVIAAAVGAVALPVALAIAVPTFAMLGGAQLVRQLRAGRRSQRGELKLWVRETLQSARADLNLAAGRAHAGVTQELEGWLRERVWERRSEINRAVAALNGDRQRSRDERVVTVRECEGLIRQLEALRAGLVPGSAGEP